MRRLVGNRWFSLADLAVVSISIILWELKPDLGWRPLFIALSPWIFRILARKAPIKRTKFDIAILVFLLTAAMGVWAAYDREAAWDKFWLLLGGILIFYVFVNQPKENLWPVICLICIITAGIAGYFLVTYDWQYQPADFQVLTRLGQWWMAHRPTLELGSFAPNITGGILAMLLPFPFVLSLHAWRQRKLLVLIFAYLVGSMTFIGLLMTSSRAAWAALTLAFGCWFLWVLAGWINLKSNQHFFIRIVTCRRLFILLLLVIGGMASIIISNSSGGLTSLFNFIPGTDDGSSRLELYRNSLSLFQDFLFTGGGLATFAGLYSRYILVIPYYFFGYAHNLYLDLALEQGLFGILAFLAIYVGCIWLLISNGLPSSFHWAILTSLIVIGLHGILDDALYGMQGTPFLFLSAGLAVASVPHLDSELRYSQSFLKAGLPKKSSHIFIVLAIVVILVVILFVKPVSARWYANLGSVQMARAELPGFPTGQWEDNSKLIALASSEQHFERALQLSHNDVTANYHLGLITMLRRNYPLAIDYLKDAFNKDPEHRGIRKNLSYSFVWTGQFDRALPLLQTIPESRNEMDVYSWWWGTQGRIDLAENAQSMVLLMDDSSNSLGIHNKSEK